MQLSLDHITKTVGPSVHLYPLSLAPVPGAVTVLLGATQAGKTSLMRVMAGLDTASSGRVLVDGEDVTRRPVRERNVAMVYQQFVNYPSMTVAQNIASPLRLRGERDVEARVRALAARLHIEPFLDRLPAELSGGQQQRVALARALAKRAPLMLLDEPLVNLDYKLREELREELSALFAAGEATVVYATTEPGEALLLGGHTAVMDAGELLQYGPTAEVFHRPKSLRVARAFSDPPMNLLPARRSAQGGLRVAGALDWPLDLPLSAGDDFVLGVRAGGLRERAQPGDLAIEGRVELAEIAGSDTFVHVHSAVGELVAQLVGVHKLDLGAPIRLYLHPDQLFVFDASGPLVRAPLARQGAH
ncbi:ABC transporter ATP-binding protein [Hydrogenophaga sp. YM1]|uniref:ABC transporter ATP-binding protein n=1 Tax=unclassified Hydrogenophaga TaxID=2610897 RepID=UPI00086EC409|nr:MULTISPECIES: ABC transporter ATP-binding protein [unclassified Hydrogenophaga]MBN9370872.1 ABC transporter ATP-binding protein [Hydrogenophaga sp.]ODT29886.1 MAG: ABC transporter [Hydrogenophaga sp. SCN 70-13]OJV35449.1 MAG: ABC transporter [Hydrogenophaga sp. 70-12]QRR33712.1 ABC transporter ATP-binding protein [Hydrogenophaga sp. YM1]